MIVPSHERKINNVIGFKRGTGGTGGVSYLRKMFSVMLFHEIPQLGTNLYKISLWSIISGFKLLLI